MVRYEMLVLNAVLLAIDANDPLDEPCIVLKIFISIALEGKSDYRIRAIHAYRVFCSCLVAF